MKTEPRVPSKQSIKRNKEKRVVISLGILSNVDNCPEHSRCARTIPKECIYIEPSSSTIISPTLHMMKLRHCNLNLHKSHCR